MLPWNKRQKGREKKQTPEILVKMPKNQVITVIFSIFFFFSQIFQQFCVNLLCGETLEVVSEI